MRLLAGRARARVVPAETRTTLIPVAAAALFLAAGPLSAQETGWTLGGSLTQRLFGAAAEAASDTDYSYGSVATLETTLRATGSTLRAEFSAEASLLAGSSAQAFALAVQSGVLSSDTLYAPSDLSYPTTAETVLAARVRTAYVKWSARPFALTVGRQIVNYGKGTAWSPVDIFTETDYSGLSLVRQGSDAVRLTVPLGTLSLAEAVAAPVADPSDGAYALRLAGLIFDRVDGSLVGAWDGAAESWTAGADAKIDLPFASLYADAALALRQDRGGVLRAVAGFDTSFGDFVLIGEYYHNGGGSDADSYFPGAHNLYAALSWDLADYHTLALSGLIDIENGIFSVQTTWAHDLAQNGTLTAYAKIGNGSFPSGSRIWTAQAGAQFSVAF